MLRITLIISGVVIFALILVSFVAGVFDSVRLSKEMAGPYNLIYREYRGPFSGIRLTLNDVYKYVRDQKKVRAEAGFGIFYDNPANTPQDSLRSIAGVITDSLIEVNDPYKSGSFRETEAIVGRFPIRSLLSYVMGTGKFYPSLQKFLEENNLELSGPVMEIYNSSEKRIIYIAPVGGKVSPAPEFGK